MIQGNVSLTKKDYQNPDDLKKLFSSLKTPCCYIGIPEDQAARKSTDKISNAQLLFVHTNGSPIHHIPPRPVIEPALAATETRKAIEEGFRQMALDALSGKKDKVARRLKLLGVLGSKAARMWFVDPRNGWPPLKEATIRHKLDRLKGKRREAALGALNRGESSFEFEGSVYNVDTPLIDTSQMRNAITWVIRNEQGSLITGQSPHPNTQRTHGATVDTESENLEEQSLPALRDMTESAEILE